MLLLSLFKLTPSILTFILWLVFRPLLSLFKLTPSVSIFIFWLVHMSLLSFFKTCPPVLSFVFVPYPAIPPHIFSGSLLTSHLLLFLKLICLSRLTFFTHPPFTSTIIFQIQISILSFRFHSCTCISPLNGFSNLSILSDLSPSRYFLNPPVKLPITFRTHPYILSLILFNPVLRSRIPLYQTRLHHVSHFLHPPFYTVFHFSDPLISLSHF